MADKVERLLDEILNKIEQEYKFREKYKPQFKGGIK